MLDRSCVLSASMAGRSTWGMGSGGVGLQATARCPSPPPTACPPHQPLLACSSPHTTSTTVVPNLKQDIFATQEGCTNTQADRLGSPSTHPHARTTRHKHTFHMITALLAVSSGSPRCLPILARTDLAMGPHPHPSACAVGQNNELARNRTEDGWTEVDIGVSGGWEGEWVGKQVGDHGLHWAVRGRAGVC